MPYMLVRSGDSWFVHKKREDGKPGKRMHKRPMNRARAVDYMQALYAQEQKEVEMETATLRSKRSRMKPIREQVKAEDARVGFRELSDTHWVAFYSNNFRDLEDEFFSAKAIDQFIAKVDSGEYSQPYLFFWHIPVPLGQAKWLSRVGHTVAAVGEYGGVDKEITERFRTYFRRTDTPLFTSHGFFYKDGDKVEGVFTRFRTFEISVVPMEGVPANPLTIFKDIEVEMPKIDDEKKAKLTEILGDELADKFIDLADKYSEEIKRIGLDYRELEAAKSDMESDPSSDENLIEAPVTDNVASGANEADTLDIEVPEVVSDDSEAPEIESIETEVPESVATQQPDEEGDKGFGSRPVEPVVTSPDSAVVALIRELSKKVDELQTAYTGLSDYVRLQFGDPRPASKSQETQIVPEQDKELEAMIKRFKGDIGPNDPLRDILPMFFEGE